LNELALRNLKFESNSQIRAGRYRNYLVCVFDASSRLHERPRAEGCEKRMKDNAIRLKRPDKDESWGKRIQSRVEDWADDRVGEGGLVRF